MGNPYIGTTWESSWEDGYRAAAADPISPLTPPMVLQDEHLWAWEEGAQEGRGNADPLGAPNENGSTGADESDPTPMWTPPRAGPVAIVAGDAVVAYGHAKQLDRNGDLSELVDLAKIALRQVFQPVVAAIDLANALGWTAAVGVDVDMAYLGGLSAGAGLYFGPDDEWGAYTSLGEDLGLVIGASATACFTVVNGGPSRLGGQCLAVEVSAGGGWAAIGGAVLYTPAGDFLGVAAELGIGLGIPINVYTSFSTTHLYGFDWTP